jgi:hypothetical protein
MKLSKEDATLYYRLMWGLLCYVNKKKQIIPNVSNADEMAQCTAEDKVKVRTVLLENKTLIAQFTKDNPENLSEEHLSIVSSWKNLVSGNFHVERFLKNYTIFIQDRSEVYGVIGLEDELDQIIHKSHLPLYIIALLLPFKGRIIYDGIFQSYNVFFGGGIKRDLKESYMIAKQNDRIIETLETNNAIVHKDKPSKVIKSWKPELNKLAKTAKPLKGGSDSPTIHSPAFSLVKASIEFAQLAESDQEDTATLLKPLKKVDRALRKSYTVLERQEDW